MVINMWISFPNNLICCNSINQFVFLTSNIAQLMLSDIYDSCRKPMLSGMCNSCGTTHSDMMTVVDNSCEETCMTVVDNTC